MCTPCPPDLRDLLVLQHYASVPAVQQVLLGGRQAGEAGEGLDPPGAALLRQVALGQHLQGGGWGSGRGKVWAGEQQKGGKQAANVRWLR